MPPSEIQIYESPVNDSLTIPARCEVIRRMCISPGGGDVYVPNQRIADNVFVGRTIMSRQNPYVRVMNLNDEPVFLRKVTVQSETLSNFNVYDPPNRKTTRPEVLQKLQKNFPPLFHNSLTKLCSDYNDVFALETDKVTFNNFYKQKLRLKDETPVYFKNYKIPRVEIFLRLRCLKSSKFLYGVRCLFSAKRALIEAFIAPV